MYKSTLLACTAFLALSLPSLAQSPTETCDVLAASPLDPSLPSEVSGVPFGQINVAEAETACRAASETDPNPRYAFQLGRTLMQAERFDEAIRSYQTAADQGHTEAMTGLAQALVASATERSRALMQTAAESGNINALYNLGVLALDHDEDGAQALSYFAKAAELGDSAAAYNIAVMYDEGTLLIRDTEKAREYYKSAVAQDYTWAKVNLAHLLLEGTPSPEDRSTAIALLVAAADDDGDTNAGLDLALLLQSGDDIDAAESAERMITALRAKDYQLAGLLVNENSGLSEANRKALWNELSVTAQQDIAGALKTFYGED